jgi:peptide/nickel transport system permease protein
MAGFLLRRVALLVPILFGISVVAFLLMYLIPGDVVDILMGTESGDPARLAELRRLLGLDRPLVTRYLEWLGGVLQGDLGRSFVTRRTVSAEILSAFPVTLQLACAALAVALVAGVPLGIVAAIRRGTVQGTAVSVVALLGLSVPNFWLGILLLLFASLYLGWFPPQGPLFLWQEPWEAAKQLFFPSVSLGVAVAAMVMRMTRACLLDVLGQDYVRTARAKGLREWRVLMGHAFRNAMIPVLTLAGLQFGYLLGGTVVTENIFSLPGMGTLVLRSIAQRDLPVVQGVLLIAGASVVLLNLAVDFGYALLDPRLRAR